MHAREKHTVVFSHSEVPDETIEFSYLKMMDVDSTDLENPEFARWVIKTAVIDPPLTDEMLRQLGELICQHLLAVITTETPHEPQ